MNLLSPQDGRPLDETDLAMRPAYRVTPFWEYLGASAGMGFDRSTPGRAVEEQAIQAKEREAYGDLSRFEGLDSSVGHDTRPPEELERLRAESPYLSQEDFVRSPWFRQGMEYTGRMTPVRAQAMAEAYDERRERDSLVERSPTGLRSAAGFLAGMAGGLPDPINFIPFIGPTTKLGMMARFGPLLGRSLASGAEAAAGNALALPVVMGDLRARGETFELGDYGREVLLGGALGAGLIGPMGRVWAMLRHGETRAGVRAAWDVHQRAAMKATTDVAAGEAADLGRVLAEHLGQPSQRTRDDLAAGLLRSGWPEDRAAGFLAEMDAALAAPWAARTSLDPAAWWAHHIEDVRVAAMPEEARAPLAALADAADRAGAENPLISQSEATSIKDGAQADEQARRAAQEAHAVRGGEATSAVQGQGSGRPLESEAHAARQDILAGAVDDSTQRGTLDFERFSLLSERAIEDGRLTAEQVFDLYDEIKGRISGLDDLSIRDAEEITGPLERSQWLADQLVEMERQHVNAAEARATADELRGIALEQYTSIIGRIRKLGGVSSDWVRTFHGPGVAEDLQSKLGYDIISRKGVKPDEIAGELGFTDDQGLADGQALVEYLQDAPSKKQIQEQYKASREGRLRFAAAMYKNRGSLAEFLEHSRQGTGGPGSPGAGRGEQHSYHDFGAAKDFAGVLRGLGIEADAPQVLLPSFVARHDWLRHPDLTLADWERLPSIVSSPHEAVAANPEVFSNGKAAILAQYFDGKGQIVVGEYVRGGKKGERFYVTTTFTGEEAAARNWMEGKRLGKQEESLGAGGAPGVSPSPERIPGASQDISSGRNIDSDIGQVKGRGDILGAKGEAPASSQARPPLEENIAPDTAWGKGLSTAEVEAAVAPFRRGRSTIHVVETYAELPGYMQAEARARGLENGVAGAADPHTGDLWLVADSLHSPDAALEFLRHEGLHHGLFGRFGEHPDPAVMRQRMEALDGFLAQTFDHFGEEALAPIRERYNLDFANPQHRLLAAEEHLAAIAGKLTDALPLTEAERTWWDKFTAFLRELLGQEDGEAALPAGELTDREIARVVRDSVRWSLEPGEARPGGAGPVRLAAAPHATVEFNPENRAIVTLRWDADPAQAVREIAPAMEAHWRDSPPAPRDLRPPRPRTAPRIDEAEDAPGMAPGQEAAARPDEAAATSGQAEAGAYIPEAPDLEALRQAGRLTPDDETHLAEAAKAATWADRAARAWQAAAECLRRS